MNGCSATNWNIKSEFSEALRPATHEVPGIIPSGVFLFLHVRWTIRLSVCSLHFPQHSLAVVLCFCFLLLSTIRKYCNQLGYYPQPEQEVMFSSSTFPNSTKRGHLAEFQFWFFTENVWFENNLVKNSVFFLWIVQSVGLWVNALYSPNLKLRKLLFDISLSCR